MRIIVVTGVSGAGKSTALRALEDLGFFCVDNLPLPLLGKFVELLSATRETEKAALVVDAREGEFLRNAREEFRALREADHPLEVLFLDAGDDILLRRFSETRRRHPLAGEDLRAGIQAERALLGGLREEADAVVDTGHLNVHQLKGIVQERYGRQEGALALTLVSFGFKHGLPPEADLVIDVRFLPNPYFVEKLSAGTGLDHGVAEFVLGNDDARELLAHTEGLLRFAIPRYEREGKAYLTVAVGCTGGRHRSVAIAEELGRRMRGAVSLSVRHRDLDRSP